MDAEALVALLAEYVRLRVFAAIALGAVTVGQIQSMTGFTESDVNDAVRRLSDGGLVTIVEGGLVVQIGVLRAAAGLTEPAGGARLAPEPAERLRDGVLRAFFVDGRLVSIPSKRSRRQVVLEYIVTRFSPGVRYHEREVNAILLTFHPDIASLRRYLVDHELLARDSDGTSYWRIGGPID
jgi:hypothetical protein